VDLLIKRHDKKNGVRRILLLLVVVLLTACKAKEPGGSSVTLPPEAPIEQVTIPVTDTPTPIPATPTPTPRITDVNLDEVTFSEYPCEGWLNDIYYGYNESEDLVFFYKDAGAEELCAFFLFPINYYDGASLGNTAEMRSYLDRYGEMNEIHAESARLFESIGLIYYGHSVDWGRKSGFIRGILVIATRPQMEAVFRGENKDKPYVDWYWSIKAASREDFEQDTVVNVLMQ